MLITLEKIFNKKAYRRLSNGTFAAYVIRGEFFEILDELKIELDTYDLILPQEKGSSSDMKEKDKNQPGILPMKDCFLFLTKARAQAQAILCWME